jgi:eukaryotic-like serine/threonine-protein kinase
MILSDQHLPDEQLAMLILDPEHSSLTEQIATHVESCIDCQRRLDALIFADDIYSEAVKTLSGSCLSETRQSLKSSMRPLGFSYELDDDQRVMEADESYLLEPSHPELLGRIDRYEVERRIGAGGMGVVYKALDTDLHRTVAIKVLAPQLARIGAARQRFHRESRAAAAVVHEHVVAIYNVESNTQFPYLVMQYVQGESLQSRVERQGPLSIEEILRIGIQCASGLYAAHQQGIVHRDVKPGNILLEAGLERVLLTDFGLARTVDDASLTHTGVVAGTPHYMSPEQANGDPVDFRSDLFSLGSVLYFIATGHPPFRADRAMGVLNRTCHHAHRPVWQVNSQVPTALSKMIDRLLEKRPARRPANALEVQLRLTAMLHEHQTRPGHRLAIVTRSIKSYKKWLVASLLIMATLGFGWIVGLYGLDFQSMTSRRLGGTLDLSSSQPGPTSPPTSRPNHDETALGEVAVDNLETLLSDTQWREELQSLQSFLQGLESVVSKTEPPLPNQFEEELKRLSKMLFTIEQRDHSLSKGN